MENTLFIDFSAPVIVLTLHLDRKGFQGIKRHDYIIYHLYQRRGAKKIGKGLVDNTFLTFPISSPSNLKILKISTQSMR